MKAASTHAPSGADNPYPQEILQDLLNFWFAPTAKAAWYNATPAFDAECRLRFGAMVDAAAKGELTHWAATADGALALVLLLDQLPRNIHRGTAGAFAHDEKALTLAREAIERGFDQRLDTERRVFLYLPFMHSEALADQEQAVTLCRDLDDRKTLAHAEDHAAIIRRFGRFPHRNAILGRESTADELAFLDDDPETFGQPPKS